MQQINVLVDNSSGGQYTVNVYDYIGENCVCFLLGTSRNDRRSKRVLIAGCRENSRLARKEILNPLFNEAALKGIGFKLSTPHGFRSERNAMTYSCSQPFCPFHFSVYWDVDIKRWYLWPSGAGNPLHNHLVFIPSLLPRPAVRRPPIIFQPIPPPQPVFLWLLPRPVPFALPSSNDSSIALRASHLPQEFNNWNQRCIKSAGSKYKYMHGVQDKALNGAMVQTDTGLQATREVSRPPKEDDNMATSHDLSQPVIDVCKQNDAIAVSQQHEISRLSNKPSQKYNEANPDLCNPANPQIVATTKDVYCEPQIASTTRKGHCNDLAHPVSDVCKQNHDVAVSQQHEISGFSNECSQKHQEENTGLCTPASPKVAATTKEVHCEPQIAATTREVHCNDLSHPVSDVCKQNSGVTLSQQRVISGRSHKRSQKHQEEGTDLCIPADSQIAATTKKVRRETQIAATTKEAQSNDNGNPSFFKNVLKSIEANPLPIVDDGFADSDEEIYC